MIKYTEKKKNKWTQIIILSRKSKDKMVVGVELQNQQMVGEKGEKKTMNTKQWKMER